MHDWDCECEYIDHRLASLEKARVVLIFETGVEANLCRACAAKAITLCDAEVWDCDEPIGLGPNHPEPLPIIREEEPDL